MRTATALATLTALSCLWGSGAAAQQAATRGMPGTIVGIVLEPTGVPIAGAEVFYGDDRVRALTGADGIFQFRGVSRGTYTVTARHLGFVPQSVEVEVADSGAKIHFELEPVAHALPAAVTKAKRLGLSGIVTDSAFRPLPGVMIEALGGAAGRAETDSTGRFHLDAEAGHYLVQASRDGFRSVRTGVVLQQGEGAELNLRMIPDAAYSLVRERVAAAQMRQRLALRSRASSRVYTREDIAELGAKNVDELVRLSGLSGSACMATLDGIWFVPAWAVDLADVDFLELYQGGVVSTARARTGLMVSSARNCKITVYATMRR